MANDLLAKLKKNSTVDETAILAESKYVNEIDMIDTGVPVLNVVFSGRFDGGFSSGVTMLAGPSKNGKTLLGLLLGASYMRKYPDAVMLFYDSEFGSPTSYFKNMGIDPNRVLHCPITDVEQLKIDLSKQLDGIKRGDHVFIMVDSVGNLASRKEVTDALNEKSVGDMTRAKAVKSLFRIVTTPIKMRNIPLLIINHTYSSMDLFPTEVIASGRGAQYAADTTIIMGRRQEKKDGALQGYDFVMNVDKSRFVREKTKISLELNFDEGINKWSGLLDMAQAAKAVSGSAGWYQVINADGEISPEKVRASAMDESFWNPMIQPGTRFYEAVRNHYSTALETGSLLADDEIDEDMEEVTQ